MPRVLSLPRSHPYLDRVLPPGWEPVAGHVGLPDPLWEPQNLVGALTGVDVVHVHFGFDHVDPARLAGWVAAVRSAGCGLVVTVHDLRNPHHDTADLHHRQLSVLLSAADEVLTLTRGAAAEIRARYGRSAQVLPHPAIFDGPAPVAKEPGLVGLHLKSLRRNLVDLPAVVDAVLVGVRAGGGRLVCGAHREVAGSPVLAEVALRTPVRWHDRLDDEALRESLTRLHALVLPHRFGTHSGLLEACRDVGTAVIAPRCGHLADQWPAVVGYDHDERRGLSAASLAGAVTVALAAPPPPPVDRSVRDGQQRANREAHAAAYGRVAAAHRAA